MSLRLSIFLTKKGYSFEIIITYYQKDNIKDRTDDDNTQIIFLVLLIIANDDSLFRKYFLLMTMTFFCQSINSLFLENNY